MAIVVAGVIGGAVAGTAKVLEEIQNDSVKVVKPEESADEKENDVRNEVKKELESADNKESVEKTILEIKEQIEEIDKKLLAINEKLLSNQKRSE